MCGIVGYIGKGLAEGLLAPLLNSMAHRGPDGAGTYRRGPLSIGMRRLSVIALEDGWQPLYSRDGRVVVFQNGEIYNYRSLRAELEARGYVFRTGSDTEVIAHGYDAWAIDGLLDRLDGMYAIAIHDQDSNELHLARDRFGEKPMFWSATSDAFAFGSTLLAISAMPWVSTAVDALSLDRYLALHFIPGRRTIFRDVQRVLPGEVLTVGIDTLAVRRRTYYKLRLDAPRRIGDRELTERLEEAVRSRLMADVPVGVFLSGGVDSSTIAAIAARTNRQIATFSIGFDDRRVDESDVARAVARHIGSTHHEFQFGGAKFRELLPAVASALDEPVGDQATLPLYWLCQEVKQHVTVVLSGEGADEIFAGYGYYGSFAGRPDWRTRLKAALGRPAPSAAAPVDRLLNDTTLCTPSGFPLLTTQAERRALANGDVGTQDEWEAELMGRLHGAHGPLQQATAADALTWLPDDLLVKVDRMTMAHSIEGRAPYLAPGLAEVALNLPSAERMADGGAKIALRRVARRYLPDEVVRRRKQGFVLPMRAWLDDWFGSRGSPAAYVASCAFPLLDSPALAQLIGNDLAAGVQRERLLFAIAMLLEWWQSFAARRAQLLASVDVGQHATAADPSGGMPGLASGCRGTLR